MQAGTRAYPDRFPAQHLRKPGLEADLKEAPMYEAPGYKGSDKLKGMVAIITGGDSGIGRAVAVLYAKRRLTVTAGFPTAALPVSHTRTASARSRSAWLVT